MTLAQLKRLIASSYQVNIATRSLVTRLHALSGEPDGSEPIGSR